MKTVGFPIGKKENEFRRALIPSDLCRIENVNCLFFEEGYGEKLGIDDKEYIACGANICSHDQVLSCDIICDPKIGDADYLEKLKDKIIFGWIHAVQNREITDKLLDGKLTAFAWEDMFEEGRHVFWRNNELAGEAAIMDAFRHYGKMPYECSVAIIGRGNVAQGALKLLTLLGAQVTSYNRKTENLFKKEISQFDVIVNCVLWDTSRKDHIISDDDICSIKNGALIIDISCDKNGGIEFSVPTTIDNPVYYHKGIMVYAVDHTPSLFYKTSTKGISEQISKYIDLLITETENDVLKKCRIINKGEIIDNRIVEYQNR